MVQSFNPKRLTLARKRRGLTKAALAEAMGVSPRMVTAYERGEKEPGPLNMAKIADVLEFPVDFLGGPDLDEPPLGGSSFRALSSLTARQRDQGLGSAAIALALSDWIDARFKLPDSDVPRLRGVDPETAAMAVRSEWALGERPIRNTIHLLEAHGVRIFSLVEECRELDAFSFWRGELPYVFLNTLKSGEHGRMDAAHELGHLVLHWKGETPRSREAEREADAFGSAFLMPHGSVLAEAPRGAHLASLIEAKHRWNVPVAGLAYRMHKLGLLSEWQYRTLFVQMSKRGYRTNEPESTHAETSQVFQKVFRALRDEGVTMHDVARQLCILPDELDKSVFGLILTPVDGLGVAERGTTDDRPRLRLV